MAIIQGTSADRNLFLSLASVAATGILPADVVCKYKKNGQSSFTTKVLDGTSWIELGDGYYAVRFSAAEMNTLGTFFFTLTGDGFDNFTSEEFSIEPSPSIVSPLIPPEVCIVRGSILTLGAQLPAATRIVARPVEFPAKVGSSLVQAEPVITFADAEGLFSLRLVRNAVVVIEIDRAGIRHQITVPNQAEAELDDLLPPSIIDYT